MKDLLACQAASHCAEMLVKKLGLDTLPIDPIQIAADHQILVEAKKSTQAGVSGFLMRVGNSFGIAYATHIESEGFKRFTVSHELGHFFLPGHSQHLFPDGDGIHASRSGFITRDQRENEADHFAAALLMPTALIKKELNELGTGFKAIEELATRCITSITATAIRYAELTDDSVIVVVSSGDVIDYCFPSEPLRNLTSVQWFTKSERIPVGTATKSFAKDKKNIELAKRDESWTRLDDWFDRAPKVEMKEDVVGLGTYGKILTVLHTDEALEVDAEDDD